jgi:tetratricopeptide (TPR) repeat protein
MSFFKKKPGKKPADTPAPAAPTAPAAAAPQPAAPASPAPASDPSKDPNMIRGFDAFGREVYITKQQWRETIMPGHLQKVWADPDQLSRTIHECLARGLAGDMVAAAEHLAEIDSNPERGAVVLAIVYRESNRPDDAEQVLRRFIDSRGETSQVLATLASVHDVRGEHETALATAWHALELDSNQENGFGLYLSIVHKQNGEAAAQEALQRIAALPASWRARLWIAHDALAARQLEAALGAYREALELAGQPIPGELLVQMSGDLGQAGHLTELIQLTAAHFSAATHGPLVGSNLIRAYLGLGRPAPARAVLDQLVAQQRPDWQEPLDYWNAQLAKAEFVSTASTEPPTLAMLMGDGPAWLPARSSANELFPAPTAAPIAFLGSTAEIAARDDAPVVQLSELAGRLSRAIPLLLAEQVRFSTLTPVHPLTTWMKGSQPVWALGRSPWQDAAAAAYVRGCAPTADYLVVTHLVATADPWRVELRLIRASDGVRLTTKKANLPLNQPEAALRRLGIELIQSLVQHADRTIVRTPPTYSIPTGPAFNSYLLTLEQLLCLNFGTSAPTHGHFLAGERETIDGFLKFCLAQPESVVLRLQLAQALVYLKDARPQSVAAFRDKVRLLQEQMPLAAPAQEVLQRLFAEVYP